jgi:hypothetical protein
MAWVLLVSMLTLLPAASGSAAATTFDPLPNATTVNNGVYASVVSDGAGTYHSVMREDGFAQGIVYRRSSDGGRTWVPAARWTGESGGGTRPVIAVDESTVAVVFIGALCEPGSSVCGEAPYLVRSTDGGASFGAPMRLHNNAFHVSVGVDGSRTWVAWLGRDVQNTDVVFMRGYGADGKPFAERTVPGGRPTVTAGGGGGVVSFARRGVGDGEEGSWFARAQLLDGAGFGAVDEVPLDGAPNHSLPVDAASAAGLVHLLYRQSPFGTTSFFVRSAAVGSQGLGSPVPAITGTGASIAARSGLVAVSAVDPATGVTSVVRSADGAGFTPPSKVAVTEGGAYRTDLTVAAGWGTGLGSSSTVGDLYVATSGNGEMTLVAAREGVCPPPEACDPITALWQRRVDAVTTGSGFVSPGGRPATDGVSAVVAWTQLSQGSVFSWQSLLAQAAIAENVGVAEVSFDQGAKGAGTLVIDRPTKVLAKFRSALAEPRVVTVTTVVNDVTDGPGGPEVLRATDSIRLQGGDEFIGLPASAKATFAPQEGRRYVATVRVSDPPPALPSDAGDNELVTAPEDFPALARTRDLSVLVGPLQTGRTQDPGNGVVSCEAVRDRVLRRGVPLASAMMPVAAGVRAEISCTPWDAVDHNPAIDYQPAVASKTLTELDYYAHLMGRDVVVAVAPKGWLQRVTGVSGIVGLATTSGRGAIVDVDGRPETFAHEISHNMGLGHDAPPASGLWVSRNEYRAGVDYMVDVDTVDTREWVSATTWDGLVEKIGGPEQAPRPPGDSDTFVYVQGTATYDPETRAWESGRTTKQPKAAPAPRVQDPDAPAIDLVVRQVDGQGQPVDEQPVVLSPVEGVGAAVESPGGGTYPFSAYVELDAQAAALQTVLDGEIVESRPIGAPPTVTNVLAPADGAPAQRGGPLQVSWAAADTDSDDLTTDLLVSGNGGATWKPLATRVGPSPATVTVPADLDGDQVKVRVVVSDGVRMAMADSAEFTVGGTTYEVRDHLVFERSIPIDYFKTTGRVFTMDPDGTDIVEVGLPRNMSWEPTSGYSCREPQKDGSCPAYHRYPAWSPDGARLYFSSDLVDTRFGGGAVARDYVSAHIWSAAADGSDLRRVTTPQPTSTLYPEGNFCPDASADRVVWAGRGRDYAALYAAALDGSGFTRLISTLGPSEQLDKTRWPRFVGSGWKADATTVQFSLSSDSLANGPRDQLFFAPCPRVSPDGDSVAFVASVQQDAQNGSTENNSAVVVMGIDGSDPRVVTDRYERFGSVDWIDDDRLVATKVANLGFQGDDFTAIELDLLAAAPSRTTIATWKGGAAPDALRSAPDGTFYGSRPIYGTPDPGLDLAMIDATGVVATITDPAIDRAFDWSRALTPGGPDVPVVEPPVEAVPDVDAGGPYSATAGVALVLTAGGRELTDDPTATAEWDLDGDGKFDDAQGRNPEVVFPSAGTVEIRVRVTPSSGGTRTSDPSVVTVVAGPDPVFTVDPAAEGSPVVAAPVPVDLRVEVPAGQPSGVRLGAEGGPPVPWVVVGFDAQALAVRSGDPSSSGTGLPTAGGSGSVEVTPVEGFTGTSRMTYAHPDDLARTATVEVVVTGGGGEATPPSPPPTSPPTAGPPTVAPPQVSPDAAPVVSATTSGKVYFAYKSVRLSKAEKRKLRRVVARIPDGATVVLTRSVGVVKGKGATAADKRRALKRARVVRDYLLAQGLTGPIQVSNGGRTAGKSAKARRVDVTVTYTLRQ